VNALSAAAAARVRRSQIGFIFQKHHLVRGLTALDNVCLPLVLAGVGRSTAVRRGMELLSQVGLAEKARVDPRRLSVGQCQRVAIARALAGDPALILADEPTASLDESLGQQAMRLLRTLTVEAGKTAIVVTHDPRIERFADRILFMEGGQLFERGGVAQARTASADQCNRDDALSTGR
jgi:putative ABC transport system ATP-binding protein